MKNESSENKNKNKRRVEYPFGGSVAMPLWLFDAILMGLVRLSWRRDIYCSKCDVAHWTVAAQAYLLHLLGCTLFANKSATHMHVVFLDAFRDLTQSESYAWGVAALVHMYNNLNDASKSSNKQLARCITLLQVIIIELDFFFVLWYWLLYWFIFFVLKICVVLDL